MHPRGSTRVTGTHDVSVATQLPTFSAREDRTGLENHEGTSTMTGSPWMDQPQGPPKLFHLFGKKSSHACHAGTVDSSASQLADADM